MRPRRAGACVGHRLRQDPVLTPDPFQARAITCRDRRILCLATAGSGKTETLIARVVHAMGHVAPNQILAITFTNRAAEEMRMRLVERTGPAARRVRISTFHRWAAQMVRVHAPLCGRSPSYVIYDEDDRALLLSLLAQQLGVKTRARKADSIRCAALRQGFGPLLDKTYAATLARHDALDFDGLIDSLATILDNAEARRAIVKQLRYVLVDEYQDTSRSQVHLLRQVRDVFGQLDPPNLYLVGDEMQAIYGFRGADVAGIRDAAADEAVTVLRLPVNYRSTRPIVDLGNAVARSGGSPLGDATPGRPDADDWAGCVHVQGHADDVERSAAIASDIIQRVQDGEPEADIMVLARRWGELDGIASALSAAGVQHTIPRRTADAWGSHGMRWLVSLMKLAINPDDVVAACRVAAWPTPIASPSSVYAIADARGLAGLHAAHPRKRFAGPLADYLGAEDRGAVDLADRLVRRSYHPEIDTALNMIDQWHRDRVFAGAGTSARHFVAWYGLRDVQDGHPCDVPEGVRLLSIHAAKGLEAPVVHITGLDAGAFPHGKDIDEDLRLFYVAVTRARDVLCLHWARSARSPWGRPAGGPSPFLDLIGQSRGRDDASDRRRGSL